MTIGAGLFLIALGAILRFGVTTVSTHGFGIHTIGDILMVIGVLGVVLWLIVFAPWGARSRSRRTTVYRSQVPSDPAYRGEVPPGEVPPAPRYPVEYRYEDEYRP